MNIERLKIVRGFFFIIESKATIPLHNAKKENTIRLLKRVHLRFERENYACEMLTKACPASDHYEFAYKKSLFCVN